MRQHLIAVSIFLALLLNGCAPQGNITPSQDPTNTADPPTASPQPPTSTPQPEIVYLHLTDAAEVLSTGDLVDELNRLSEEDGLELRIAEAEESLPENTVLLVTTADGEPLAQLMAQRPEMYVIALGSQDDQTSERVTIIGPDGLKLDRAAFLAGFIGAMVTPNHRTGLVLNQSAAGSQEVQAAYRAGQEYYCGLCRPAYPPYVDYPLTTTVPSSPTPAQIESSFLELSNQDVRTIYIPQFGGPAELWAQAKEANFTVFSSMPPEAGIDGLAAVIRLAPEVAIAEVWQSALAGDGPEIMEMPVALDHRNPEHLNDARLRVVEEVLADLNSGFIQVTGESPQP